MPHIEENIQTWNSEASWTALGEEWSGPWGGSEPQWWGTLFPRLRAFLPATTILELGPGHGRWTQYLKDCCQELILVDIAQNCLDACQRRFASESHISYHLGDGKTLTGVADRSVDLAYSFDSLVHAEADALHGYVAEFARVLKPDGVAFIHHSNMGELRGRADFARKLPGRLRRELTRRGLVVNLFAWRAESTSADAYAGHCANVGLSCIGQEKIAWEFGRALMDVISLATPRGSRWERPRVVVENPGFMDEARAIARVAALYAQRPAEAPRSKAGADPS